MSHYPGLSAVSVCIPFLLFFLLLPLTLAADLPFVFGEDTPPLEGLSPQELQRLATSAPGLDEVPEISQVPEDEVMEFTDVGGKTVASGGTKSTAGERSEALHLQGVQPARSAGGGSAITHARVHR